MSYGCGSDIKDNENHAVPSSAEVKSLTELSDLTATNSELAVFPNDDKKPHDGDGELQAFIDQADDGFIIVSPGCRYEESVDSTCHVSCDVEIEEIKSIDSVRVDLVESFVTSESENAFLNTHFHGSCVKEIEGTSNCVMNRKVKDACENYVINSMDCCSPSSIHHDQKTFIESSKLCESSPSPHSADTGLTSNAGASVQHYLSSDSSSDHFSALIHSEDSYQCRGTAQDMQTENSYQSSNNIQSLSPSNQSDLFSKHNQMVKSVASYESCQSSEVSDTTFVSKYFSVADNISDDNAKKSNYSNKESSKDTSYSVNQNGADESEYKQSADMYRSIADNECKQNIGSSGEYKQCSQDIESSYRQTEESENVMLSYRHNCSEKEVSSYKQHATDDVEEMDTDTLDEEDVTCISVSPSIYQSYDENVLATCYQTSAVAGPVVQYDTSDSPASEWTTSSSSSDGPVLPGSQMPSSEAYTSTQNTVTEASTSSAKDQANTSTSSSASRHPGSSFEGNHEAVLCTGDQTFKSAAARQSALVPFMSAGRSLPYVNPSIYAGAAVVQGMGRPTVMTSSSVHIAQHPGGATIMQHQSMSTGLSGGVAHATVMQQQAMPNGVQATAVLQHRTLANGSQTMLMQQHTMTTGMGGIAQQTVVQQRVATPGSMSQAAMYHANAVRHRALATQHARITQQQGIRLVQTRVMGSPLLQTQALGSATVIRGSPATRPAAALIGHGLLRGVSQGAMMQQLVRQRYLGGPIMPGRSVQVMAGRPIRIKMTYPREMSMDT